MKRYLKFIALILVIAFVVGFLIKYLEIQRVTNPTLLHKQVSELVNAIASNVSAIRGLQFRREPKVLLINSSEVIATWGSEVPEDVILLGDIFILTLLTNPEYNVSESYTGLLGMWLAASAGDVIYIVYDVLNLNDPITYRVLAHELTHVLQSQYFNLPNPRTLDEALALRSLIEGDADLVADTYVEMIGLGVLPRISKLPLHDPYLAIQLVPYVFGEKFVKYIVNLRGWEFLNEVYANPPKTMKYVMFPEKYLVKEFLTEVEVDLSEVCESLWVNTLGPAYLYVFVCMHLNESVALDIASKWVGDKIIYCKYGDVKEVKWLIKFNDDAASKEFSKLITTLVSFRGGVECGGRWCISNLVVDVCVEDNTVMLHSRLYRASVPN